MKILLLLLFLISCAHQTKSGEESSDQIILYPSYARLKLSSELLSHALNKRLLVRKEKNQTKRNKLLGEFTEKFKQFDLISRSKVISYNASDKGYIQCKGKRSCSLNHFSLGLVCYSGDIYKALSVLKSNFLEIGEEYMLENFYAKKKRIFFTLKDQANGTKSEDYLVACK